MNMSEAMKIKRQIKELCGIETKMSDLPEVGLVLTVEKSALDMSSYKLLSEYTTENNLNLHLELGTFLISNQSLAPSKSFGVERVY
jgi:RNase P protein component